VPQAGDHGFAAAEAVPEQSAAESWMGGELVQPAGDAGREQRAPTSTAVLTCGYPEGRRRRAAPCLASLKMFATWVRCRYQCSTG